jgi:hypothetical protein
MFVSARQKPDIITQVGFDFSWDEKKVWELDLLTEELAIDELTWHLDVPFLWTKPDGYYDLLPREVIERPEQFPEEFRRTLSADITYPIDIMWWRGRWVILDGLHRLMKLYAKGTKIVLVRKVPQESIGIIKK